MSDHDYGLTPDQFRAATLAISRSGTDPLTAEQALLALYGLGIAGEAGEVADEVKKLLFHGKPLDRHNLLSEVGDVLWYADRILLALGATMADAMAANIAKLRRRYPDGWDAADKHDHEATS